MLSTSKVDREQLGIETPNEFLRRGIEAGCGDWDGGDSEETDQENGDDHPSRLHAHRLGKDW
jgi:hypothetical protein